MKADENRIGVSPAFLRQSERRHQRLFIRYQPTGRPSPSVHQSFRRLPFISPPTSVNLRSSIRDISARMPFLPIDFQILVLLTSVCPSTRFTGYFRLTVKSIKMRLRKSRTCVHTYITSKRIDLESPCWSGFEAFRIFFKTCATGAF